jgi:tetratricopeptide (TPR) repeat protein
VGMFAHYRADRKTFPAYALLFLLTSFFLIFYMNFTDHEVRDRDYFFAPAFFLWGGWMGLGATAILLWIRRAPGRIAAAAPAAGAIAAVLLLLVPVAALAMHFHTHDRRGNYIANDYAWNILTSLGRDAILFTNGDNDTFPLWYLQEVEGVRKDIRVVNLALLNTQWYIWQLKHLEPKVPLSYTDEEIQDLEPFRKRDGAIVYVKDRAVVNIVRANQWERPIYFAVTVAELMGLDKQKRLRLEGLVWRLSEKEETTVVDVEKCTENLYEHYRYRGILDDDGNLDERVAKNVNQRKLITNYSAAFSRLAIQQRNDGNYDDAIRNMEMAGRISTGYRVYEALMGPLYVEAERYEEAEAFFQKRMAEGPESLSPYLGLAFIRERQGEREEAERLYEEGIRIAPRVQDSYLGLVRLRIGSGDIEGARRALVEWLAVRPDDEQARAQLGELDRLIQAARDTVSRRRSN